MNVADGGEMTPEEDRRLMGAALTLSRRALGRVAPNPAVGCVIVAKAEGRVRVLGRGHTGDGGRPHAETEALSQAGNAARGACVYVTLEPCCHHGETPPCIDALIAAGVSRLLYAVEDPDPRVRGGGARRLREAGIVVESGLLSEEAREVNAGFFRRRLEGRPQVLVKLAASLDGRIATSAGASRWITGEAARRRGHLLRASSDGILIGSGTALQDDPMLTCRLEGMEGRSPVRIVADGRLRLSAGSRLAQSAEDAPLWILTTAHAPSSQRRALEEQGARLLDVPAGEGGGLDLAAALKRLGKEGITRLLVEGGARLAASLLREGLTDEMEWHRAPLLVGGDGYAALAPLEVGALSDALRPRRTAWFPLGEDMAERFVLREA